MQWLNKKYWHVKREVPRAQKSGYWSDIDLLPRISSIDLSVRGFIGTAELFI